MGSIGAEVEGDNRCHPVCSIAPFVNIGWKGVYPCIREKIQMEARGLFCYCAARQLGPAAKIGRQCVEENN